MYSTNERQIDRYNTFFFLKKKKQKEVKETSLKLVSIIQLFMKWMSYEAVLNLFSKLQIYLHFT